MRPIVHAYYLFSENKHREEYKTFIEKRINVL